MSVEQLGTMRNNLVRTVEKLSAAKGKARKPEQLDKAQRMLARIEQDIQRRDPQAFSEANRASYTNTPDVTPGIDRDAIGEELNFLYDHASDTGNHDALPLITRAMATLNGGDTGIPLSKALQEARGAVNPSQGAVDSAPVAFGKAKGKGNQLKVEALAEWHTHKRLNEEAQAAEALHAQLLGEAKAGYEAAVKSRDLAGASRFAKAAKMLEEAADIPALRKAGDFMHSAKEVVNDIITSEFGGIGRPGKEIFRRLTSEHDPVVEISDLASRSLKDAQHKEAIAFGSVDDDLAERIKQAREIDVRGFDHLVDADAIRHIIKNHGDEARELARGQKAVTEADFAKIPEILRKGLVEGSDAQGTPFFTEDGLPAVRFVYRENGSIYLVTAARSGKGKLAVKTLYKTPSNAGGPPSAGVLHDLSAKSPQLTSDTLSGQPPEGIVPQGVGNEKPLDGQRPATAKKSDQRGAIGLERGPTPGTPGEDILSEVSVGGKGGLGERLDSAKDAASKAYQTLVDRHDNLGKVEKLLGGDGTLARDAQRAAGIGAQAKRFLETGVIDYSTRKAVTKGYYQTLDEIQKADPAHGLHDFRAYAIAERALELEARGIKVPPKVAANAAAQVAQFRPKYGQQFKELVEFQNGVIKYARDAGFIHDEAYNAMVQRGQSYIPLQRDIEGAMRHSGGGSKFADLSTGIHSIEGSELDITDPFESIIRNTYHLVSASEKNAIGQKLVSLASNNPLAAGIIEQVANPVGKNVVTVKVGGEAQHFKLSPELYASVKGLNREELNGFIKAIGLPADALRAGATTLSPEFGAANVFRDTFAASIQSKYGFKPILDTFRGARAAFKEPELVDAWLKNGSGNATLQTYERGDVQRELARALTSGNREWVKSIMNPVRALRAISEFSEQATRLGEFRRGVMVESGQRNVKDALANISKEGLANAAHASREVTLDFARMGDRMQAANKVVAFLNSRVQGWDKLARTLSDPKTRGRAMKVLGSMATGSAALRAINMQDERWGGVPEWEKMLFWHVLVPGVPIMRIPKPQGYSVIALNPAEAITEYGINGLMGKENPAAGKLVKRATQALLNELPLPVPTAILPAVEVALDKSLFTGRSISPVGTEKMDPSMRYDDETTDVAKAIGAALSISPAAIDHLGRGYGGAAGHNLMEHPGLLFGTPGLVATEGLKAMMGGGKNAKPDFGFGPDTPIIRALISSAERGSDQRVTAFYEDAKATSQAEATFKEKMDQGAADAASYYQGHQEIGKGGAYGDVRKVLSGLRQQIDLIKQDEWLNAQQKAERIRSIRQQIGEIAENARASLK